MAKKVSKAKKVLKNNQPNKLLPLADIAGLASGIWFTSSIMLGVYDLAITGILKNTPASYFLYFGIACVLYTFVSRRKLDGLNSFVLGLLVASTAIWLFGLTDLVA